MRYRNYVRASSKPTPPPVITSITPDTGAKAGGTAITDLEGTGFFDGCTVEFDGVPATNVVYVSDTQLTCDSPAGAPTVLVPAPAQYTTVIHSYGTWPKNRMNQRRWRFSFTPTYASNSGQYSAGSYFFFVNGPALPLSSTVEALENGAVIDFFYYHETGGIPTFIVDFSLTWNALDTISFIFDNDAETLTVSGALTGDGVYPYLVSGPFFISAELDYGDVNFEGIISDIDGVDSDVIVKNPPNARSSGTSGTGIYTYT